ncbi:HEAT repeat domain-containing protein [Spirulina sp. CCNP1310]|uniref:HEAT repeat domain-containing protein n=1 Tax=Spirulina sp. CCNP1310 TaxID=3110249 RepID=UPI002B215EBA|nr:HEAT repeat domain-containing protein [Spirulina sp. CCNP1310]MEA5418132.1 HEAT repeat domain-containing protein [Spirulina sp. CCNP1310]
MTVTPLAAPILGIETAIAALRNEDHQIRYYAVWWLAKNQVQSSWSLLCELLQHDRHRTVEGGYPVRRQAARALGTLQSVEAVPTLIDVLSCDQDAYLREAVIQALAAIGDRRAVAPLLQLLRSGNSQPYEALIEALGQLQVQESLSDVKPFLKNPSERIQCAAARYCYQITRQPQYLERIIQNLDHVNPYLRWAAAFDLGAVGHLEAAQAILQANLGNSLKLLNLKRILGTILDSDRPTAVKQEAAQTLFAAMDKLLLQL